MGDAIEGHSGIDVLANGRLGYRFGRGDIDVFVSS